MRYPGCVSSLALTLPIFATVSVRFQNSNLLKTGEWVSTPKVLFLAIFDTFAIFLAIVDVGPCSELHNKTNNTVATFGQPRKRSLLGIPAAEREDETKATMAKPKKEIDVTLSKKDQKKVQKLEAQIPYHEGRQNMDEVTKIKEQIAAIWDKAKEAQGL